MKFHGFFLCSFLFNKMFIIKLAFVNHLPFAPLVILYLLFFVFPIFYVLKTNICTDFPRLGIFRFD